MNEPEKKIQVNSSSLVELKAELIRKQQEFRREKAQTGAATFRHPIKKQAGKPSIWSKKNAGVQERAELDSQEKQEKDNELERSRSRLEAKTKLYVQLSEGRIVGDEDGEPSYMVDFQQKIVDSTLEKRKQQLESKSKDQKLEGVAEDEGAVHADDDWVDYVDALGRSRRCMKKDLAELQKQDRLHNRDFEKNAPKPSSPIRDLLSEDMRRELQREKWEEEEREALEAPIGPIHYANVQHKEIRTHGTGYYQFSRDETERKQQFDVLTTLREQTMEHRERKGRLKEKREAMMEARLAKIRQKRGLPEPEKKPKEDLIAGADSEAIHPGVSSEPMKRDDTWRASLPITREWDKGKTVVRDYYEERRDERQSEFAPPQAYYSPSAPKRPTLKPFKKPTKVHRDPKTIFELKRDTLEQNSECSTEVLPKPSESIPVPQSGNRLTLDKSVEDSLKAIRAQVDGFVQPGPIDDNRYTDQTAQKDSTLHTYIEHPSDSQGYHGYSPMNAGVHSWGMGFQASAQPTAAHHTEDANIMARTDMSDIDFSLPPPPPPADLQPQQIMMDASTQGKPELGQSNPTVQEQAASSTVNQGPAQVPLFNTDTLPVSGPDASHSALADSGTGQARFSSAMPEGATDEPECTDTSGVKHSAPQPAHYSSAPCSVQPKMARYERVHLHSLPLNLPAPPTSNNIPVYRSQEAIHAAKQQGAVRSKAPTERATVHQWYRQFSYKGERTGQDTQKPVASSNPLKPASLPFQSSFIQKKADVKQPFAAVEFDPSKPPPKIGEKKC